MVMRSTGLSLDKINIDIHQCAWCLMVADARGEYTIPSDRLVNGSHGACPTCAENWLKQALADAQKARLLRAA
jgi:hypothetical protein